MNLKQARSDWVNRQNSMDMIIVETIGILVKGAIMNGKSSAKFYLCDDQYNRKVRLILQEMDFKHFGVKTDCGKNKEYIEFYGWA